MTQESEEEKIKKVLVSLGYSPDGMTEAEMKEFFQPRVTIARNPGDWPSALEEEIYVRAGLGFYEKDSRFSFTYAQSPELKDSSAYSELQSRGLISDRGLPRNPRTGLELDGKTR
jgi:hypothetical protein